MYAERAAMCDDFMLPQAARHRRSDSERTEPMKPPTGSEVEEATSITRTALAEARLQRGAHGLAYTPADRRLDPGGDRHEFAAVGGVG